MTDHAHPPDPTAPVLRLWRGWTTPADASTYARLLDQEVAPGIVARGLTGLRSFDVWRRVGAADDEVEFLTAMQLDGLDAVRQFTGGDVAGSVVPPAARRVLARYDVHAQHFALERRHLP